MGRVSEMPNRAKITIAALAAAGAVLALAVGLYFGFRLITGRGLGFGLWRVKHLGLALLNSRRVKASGDGDATSVIFLHHSTGNNLIEQGDVREQLTAAGYEFWDHNYNPIGLRDPAGAFTGYSYRIPSDNTDPDGLARIFSRRVYPLPVNALSGLLQHDVIVFKSCFPASNITSDAQLRQYKDWYLGMRDVMDRHPDHLFVVLSPPPLNPAATTPEAAARARAFADWLTSDAYLAGHPNVAAFDFFDALAEDDPAAPDANMLRAAYRDGEDSHPNAAANAAVGPMFVAAIEAAVEGLKLESNLTDPLSSATLVKCWLDSIDRGRGLGLHRRLHHTLKDHIAPRTCRWILQGMQPIAARLTTVVAPVATGLCSLAFGSRWRRFRKSFWVCSSSSLWSSGSPIASPPHPSAVNPLHPVPPLPPVPPFSLQPSAPISPTMPTGRSRCMASSNSPSRSGRRQR